MPAGKRIGRLHGTQLAPPTIGPVRAAVDIRQRPAPAVAAVICHEARTQRGIGHVLQAQVDRRADHESAGLHLGLAEFREHLAAYFPEEELRHRVEMRPPRFHAQRRGRRRFGVDRADGPVLEHPIDYIVTPRLDEPRLPHRIVAARRLRQGGEERSLGHRQFVQRFPEIGLRRRRDAVRLPAGEDLVEIELEDG